MRIKRFFSYFCITNYLRFDLGMQPGTHFNATELKARFNPEGSPLRRQQLVMLDMLKELDRICRKYGIPYFLYWGTLLGAIRHDGFIPWDDDLDVGLMRKDYFRLLNVLPQELPEHIALQTNDTDKNYFYLFAKLRDKRSFLDEGSYDRVFKERGIFIDIFPFDTICPNTQRWRLQSYAYTIFRRSNGSDSAMRKIRVLTWFNRHISFPFLRLVSKVLNCRKITFDYGIPFHKVHDRSDIFPLSTHVFEGIEVMVPGNSHSVLQSLYGDYMKLPPDLDHVYHHVERLEFYD